MRGHPFPMPRGPDLGTAVSVQVDLASLPQAVFWVRSLSFSLLCTVSPLLCAGIAEDIGGFLLPPQDQAEEIVVGDVDKEISFEDFERALLKGDVSM